LWNKVDRLPADERARIANVVARNSAAEAPVVLASALTGEGLDALARALETALAHDRALFDVTLAPEDGAGLSWLYRHTEVLTRDTQPDGATALHIRVDRANAGQVAHRFNVKERAPRNG
jgi:GTP-binding protein HflX